MKLKRIALVVLAAVLISALSVAGTMALLTQRANGGTAVTNTFQSYNIGSNTNTPLATTFTLQEHEPTLKKNSDGSEDGTYEIIKDSAAIVTNFKYTIMPGMVLPKDPFITIDGKNDVPSRLFVEVVDNLPGGCVWAMDDNWEAVKVNNVQITGANGGKLYVWNKILAGENAEDDYNIIANDQITVANDADLSNFAGNGKTLTFYAYLAQATVVVDVDGENSNSNDPADIYAACFLASPGNSTT